MECEDPKSAGDQKSQGLAAAENKKVLFVDGALGCGSQVQKINWTY